MKILILGASGLIGHKLLQKLRGRFDDVTAVLHGSAERFSSTGLFDGRNIVENVDVFDFSAVGILLDSTRPDVILNCAGITKRRPEINEPIRAIKVNSLFPHLLAEWAGENNCRVIHFSTDCVFNGKDGNYDENSPTNGDDAYGRTKALGEIRYDHCLTIRSSFIGRELSVHSELLDWFLQQKGKTIKGFTRAMYSGISTIEMARIVGDIIEYHPDIGGLHQLSKLEPISKYDLLCLAKKSFGLDVEIVPDDDFEIDATLNGSLLRSKMPIELPSWARMMDELAAEQSLYRNL
ncbi:MAG: SDR family oxidoreductase [Salaquimonas sp.]